MTLSSVSGIHTRGKAPMIQFNASSTQKKRRSLRALVATLTMAMTVSSTGGCRVWDVLDDGPHDTKMSYHNDVGLSIEYPEVAECATPVTVAARAPMEPLSLQDPSKLPTIDLALDQAIAMAMENSPAIRSLLPGTSLVGGNASTIYDPAIVSSSQGGVEAALSDFDAVYTNTLNFNNVDQPNNIATGGLGNVFTPGVFTAAQARYQSQLQKRTALGSQFSLRHVVNYDRNNRPFRQFNSDFTGWLEAEWRQPMLRGAGLQYNRIVGSSQVPGSYNGVLIARINEDQALADFESSVTNLCADVEQAYWDLSIAYRLLEANIKGRESALRTYQYQKVRLDVGAGRQDEEAQAQSQYYQFEANVQRQLGGREGLYAIEANLRYLLGMPASDGKLIKPITDPLDSKVVFDWNSALSQALERRVEIRRQRYQVKRREFELYASRLNKRPQLDFVGLYRWRGLGDNLVGSTDSGPLDGLYSSITDGNYQEWQAGFEFALPVGLRQAGVAIANAKLQLQRERAILAETELLISHDLSDAARNIDVTFQLVETNYNRYQADLRQVEVLVRRYLDGTDNINFLLQAQRSVVQSESEFYLALATYNLSIRDLHKEKGSLLAYNQIQMVEGGWEPGANRDAYDKGLFVSPRLDGTDISITPAVTRRSFNPAAVQSTGGNYALQREMAEQQREAPAEQVPGDVPVDPPAPVPVAEDALPAEGN